MQDDKRTVARIKRIVNLPQLSLMQYFQVHFI